MKKAKFRVLPVPGDYVRVWLGKEVAIVKIIEFPSNVRFLYRCLIEWSTAEYLKLNDIKTFSFTPKANDYDCGWTILGEDEAIDILARKGIYNG